MNRLTERWVDLKRMENLDPHFRQRVLETGQCIYEANFSESSPGNNHRY